MEIFSDIAAVQSRIAQITGAAAPVAPSALSGRLAAPGASATGPDGLPFLSAQGGGAFASLVQAALAGQGGLPAQSNPFASSLGLGPAPIPPAQIDSLVAANAGRFGVDPSLVKAIIANESGFNANATSSVGAQGLMQLMPATAASLGVGDSYNPAENVAGGTRYLRGLLDRFGGDTRLAVAAYNAGPGAVEKYGDVPPYTETQNYVQNVLSSYERYRAQGMNATP